MDLKVLFSRKSNYVARDVNGEKILVPISNNIAEMRRLYTLNEVGAFIWDAIDGKNTFETIVGMVVNEFNTDAETARKDTLEFLQQLQGLISEESTI